MADKTVADLPKKNAVAAEPAKSLAGTIQQVMTKAITSPSDGKVDFAQGVNHITGDPHQKSAGAADSMSTLKANAEKDAEDKEEIKAAYEADEKKDEKEKEEVKEVEMPQAALDALKKKQDKEDAKEEKEDDKKKEMKEASENDKEEDEEEEKKEAYHNKDKK